MSVCTVQQAVSECLLHSRTMQSVEKLKLEWNQELELVLTYLKSGIVEVCKSHRCSYQNEELVHSVSELCVYIIILECYF